MLFTKSTISLLLALAFSRRAAADDADAVAVVFSDIQANFLDYYSFIEANPSISFPPEYISIFTQIETYTDDSYSSLFSQIDVSEVEQIVTELPWYSSRLETPLQRALTEGVTSTDSPASSTSASSGDSTSSPTGASSASSSSVASASATDVFEGGSPSRQPSLLAPIFFLVISSALL